MCWIRVINRLKSGTFLATFTNWHFLFHGPHHKRYVPSYRQNLHVWFIRALAALSAGGRWRHLDPSPLSAAEVTGQSGNWVRPALVVQEDKQLVDAGPNLWLWPRLCASRSRKQTLKEQRAIWWCLEVHNLNLSWPLEPTIKVFQL